MNPFLLSLTILKRYWKYSVFILFALIYFTYSTLQFCDYQLKLHRELSQLASINAEVIGPKGSTVDHLKRLLKSEVIGASPIIPKNLYDTLKTMSSSNLAGILFLGFYKQTPVITADVDLFHFINKDLSSLEKLNSNEVIIGLNVAQVYGLSVNSEITIKTNFKSNVTEDISVPVKVKSIEDLGPWNSMILSSFKLSDKTFESLTFPKEQVWKNSIISYILVEPSTKSTTELENLVNKKTVASYFKITEEINGFLKFAGLDKLKDLKIIWMTLLSSIVTLFSFLVIWFPVLRQVKNVLFKLKYTQKYIIQVYFFVFGFLSFIAFVIGFTLSIITPII